MLGSGGGKGGCAPGDIVHGAVFGGANTRDSEIWPLLANGLGGNLQ